MRRASSVHLGKGSEPGSALLFLPLYLHPVFPGNKEDLPVASADNTQSTPCTAHVHTPRPSRHPASPKAMRDPHPSPMHAAPLQPEACGWWAASCAGLVVLSRTPVPSLTFPPGPLLGSRPGLLPAMFFWSCCHLCAGRRQ